MIKKLDHLVITTKDIEKCLEFYKKIGFTLADKPGRYEIFAGDFKINIHILGKELHPHAKNVTLGSADLCIEVDCDLEQLKNTLMSKGIDIELGVVERSGVRGLMQSIYLRDPDSNLIELCKYS